MNILLLSSIMIRLFAFVLALLLVRKVRDWRMGFLALMIGLMGLRQTLTLSELLSHREIEFTFPLATELPGLVVSVLALLTVVGLERLLTQRQREHQLLRESEERYRRFAELSLEGISVHAQGKFVEISLRGAEMFGYTLEALRGGSIFDLIHPDSHAEVHRRIQERDESRYEVLAVRKDQTVFPVEFHARNIEHNGRPARVVVMRDIAEHKKAEAVLHQQARRLRVQREIDQAILAARSPEEIARTVLDHLQQLIPYQRATVSQYDLAKDEIGLLAVSAKSETALHSGATFPLGLFSHEHFAALRQGQTYVANNVAEYSPVPPLIESVKDEGIQSYVHVPLLAQGELIGSLNICKPEVNGFTDEDVVIAQEVAEVLAIAISQSQLLRHEQRARQIAEIVQQANLALSFELELSQVLTTLLMHLQKLVPYDSGNVMLRDENGRLTMIAIHGYETWTRQEDTSKISFDPVNNRIIQDLMATRQSILIPNTREHPDWMIVPGAEQVTSWMGIPLIAGGEVIGLYSIDKTSPDFFTAEHMHLAEALASQAAVAIQNARFYEQAARHATELEERVDQRTAELRRMVSLMAGREIRMAELKKVIQQLRTQLLEAGIDPVADDPLIIEEKVDYL